MHLALADLLIAVGRVLMGGLFVIGGIRHFFVLEELSGEIAARGVPAAKAALVAASLFQIVAGALLAGGLYVPKASLGLIAFVLVASLVRLNFWDLEEGPGREALRKGWLNNMAIVGGLMIAAASGL